MSTLTSVPDALARARDVVHPAMAAAVERLNPELGRIAAYHLGWCDEHGVPSAGAGGAEPTAGGPGGVAVELVHNFSLLHDDVIDGDRERRHRPTVWALYGVGPAVLVGDALLPLAHHVLLEHGRTGAAASAELSDAVAAMIGGQADDMAFEGRSDVTRDQCLGMVAGKTGALSSCAAAIGSVLVG